MSDITQGKENSEDGTRISRRSVLVAGAAMVAVAALPAATFAAGTKAAQENDRPKIQLELQGNRAKVNWGPEREHWGIFKEGATPVVVEIKEWWLYVGGLVNQQKPDPGSDEILSQGSDEIFSQNVGTKTEMIIELDRDPKFHSYKVIVAQVLGRFDSKDMDGKRFEEGIYSDVAQKEKK